MENEIDIFKSNTGKKCRIIVAVAGAGYTAFNVNAGINPISYVGTIDGVFGDFVLINLGKSTILLNKHYIVSVEI